MDSPPDNTTKLSPAKPASPASPPARSAENAVGQPSRPLVAPATGPQFPSGQSGQPGIHQTATTPPLVHPAGHRASPQLEQCPTSTTHDDDRAHNHNAHVAGYRTDSLSAYKDDIMYSMVNTDGHSFYSKRSNTHNTRHSTRHQHHHHSANDQTPADDGKHGAGSPYHHHHHYSSHPNHDDAINLYCDVQSAHSKSSRASRMSRTSRASRASRLTPAGHAFNDNISVHSRYDANLPNASVQGPHVAARSARFGGSSITGVGVGSSAISQRKKELLKEHHLNLEKSLLQQQQQQSGLVLPPDLRTAQDQLLLFGLHDLTAAARIGESGRPQGDQDDLEQGHMVRTTSQLSLTRQSKTTLPLTPMVKSRLSQLENVAGIGGGTGGPIVPRMSGDELETDSLDTSSFDLNDDEEFQDASGIPYSNSGHLKYDPSEHLVYEYVRNDAYHGDKIPFFYLTQVERDNIVFQQERVLRDSIKHERRLDRQAEALELIRAQLEGGANNSNPNQRSRPAMGELPVPSSVPMLTTTIGGHHVGSVSGNEVATASKDASLCVSTHAQPSADVKPGTQSSTKSVDGMPLVTITGGPSSEAFGKKDPAATVATTATTPPQSPTALCQSVHDPDADCNDCDEIEETEELRRELIMFTDEELARPVSLCDFASRAELLAQLKLGVPLIFSFSAGYAVELVNLAFLGHLSEQALAAASMAAFYQNLTGFSLLIGLNTAIESLGSQYWGAGQPRMVGTVGLRGAIIGLIACAIIAVTWWWSAYPLMLMGIDEDIAQLAQDYCRVCIFSLPAVQLLDVTRRLFEVTQVCLPSMVVNVLGMILVAPLNRFFMYVLDWGFIGPAYSFIVVNWVMFFALAAYFVWIGQHKVTMPRRIFSTALLKGWGQYMSIAVPSAAAIGAEWVGFEIQTIIASRLGVGALSTQSLILSINALIFLIPMSIGVSASCRVGAFLGARKTSAGLLAYHTAVRITWVSQLIVGGSLWLFNEQIVSYFTNVESVKRLTMDIMPMLSLFCIVDGFQGMIQGVLRGFAAQTYAFLMNLFWFWVIALPISIYLSLYVGTHDYGVDDNIKTGMGLIGIWISLLVGATGIMVCYMLYLGTTSWTQRTNYVFLSLREEEEGQFALAMAGAAEADEDGGDDGNNGSGNGSGGDNNGDDDGGDGDDFHPMGDRIFTERDGTDASQSLLGPGNRSIDSNTSQSYGGNHHTIGNRHSNNNNNKNNNNNNSQFNRSNNTSMHHYSHYDSNLSPDQRGHGQGKSIADRRHTPKISPSPFPTTYQTSSRIEQFHLRQNPDHRLQQQQPQQQQQQQQQQQPQQHHNNHNRDHNQNHTRIQQPERIPHGRTDHPQIQVLAQTNFMVPHQLGQHYSTQSSDVIVHQPGQPNPVAAAMTSTTLPHPTMSACPTSTSTTATSTTSIAPATTTASSATSRPSGADSRANPGSILAETPTTTAATSIASGLTASSLTSGASASTVHLQKTTLDKYQSFQNRVSSVANAHKTKTNVGKTGAKGSDWVNEGYGRKGRKDPSCAIPTPLPATASNSVTPTPAPPTATIVVTPATADTAATAQPPAPTKQKTPSVDPTADPFFVPTNAPEVFPPLEGIYQSM